jgi:hypothetical protein
VQVVSPWEQPKPAALAKKKMCLRYA